MKKFFHWLFLLGGAALLADGVHLLFVSNFNFGTLLVFLCGGAFVLFGALYAKLWRWLRVTVLCGCVLVLALTGALAVYGSADNALPETNALIVLGCGIRGDRVTVGLARRLDAAVRFYKQHPDVLIVVSGGQGAQETVTEAAAMERYLLAQGVPKAQIVQEPQATSTLENLQFSDALLRERFPNGYTAAIVTSRFHTFRAVHVAAALGLSYGHLGASSKWYAVPMNYLRELCAIANELLRGTLRLGAVQDAA